MGFESNILSYLAEVTARSFCLAALALAALAILRVRTAAGRHAVGTVVVAGMLLLAAFAPLAPPIPLRVLRGGAPAAASLPEVARVVHTGDAAVLAPAAAPNILWQWPSWQQAAAAIYLLAAIVLLVRLAIGYLITCKLVKSSRRTELGPDAIYESTWITVPMTAGLVRPKILLPAGWRGWEPAKLDAVLAHERTHVRRADWGIAAMAGINRCVFWFHPVAWWLERRLAALAEQACDDAALLEVGAREPYAEALLDMAAAVKSGQGRLVWEAMAMAKASEVNMRIERILDETRQIPRGVSRRRWAVLFACSLPLIYAAAVLQLEPARAQVQDQPATVHVASDLMPADAARMEQELVRTPDDLDTRSKLIGYYFVNNIREPRLTHILWMVEHHPESDLTAFNSAGISPRATSLNTSGDYQRASSLWRQQVAAHPQDYRVLANAAQFYSQPGGDWFEAERLLQQAAAIPSNLGTSNSAKTKLANLYVRALNNPDENSAFTGQAMAELQSSKDGMFLAQVGSALKGGANAELGNQLMTRAGQFGGPRMMSSPPAGATRMESALSQAPPPAPPPPPLTLAQAPTVLSKIDPQYPALARQARIEGDVQFNVVIGPDGRVRNIAVNRGHPLLIQSAMEAVKDWVFAPALQNGVPVAAGFTLSVPFRLDGGSAPLPGNAQAMAATGAGAPPIPSRIRVGGNVQKAMLVKKVDPVYPEQARTAGPDGEPLEGTVTFSVVIGKDGSVQSVQPTAGHPLLAVAAQEAVQQWIYKPTLLNGNPVEVATTVDVAMSAK